MTRPPGPGNFLFRSALLLGLTLAFYWIGWRSPWARADQHVRVEITDPPLARPVRPTVRPTVPPTVSPTVASPPAETAAEHGIADESAAAASSPAREDGLSPDKKPSRTRRRSGAAVHEQREPTGESVND